MVLLAQPLARDLYDQLALLPTVDAHEHLHPEPRRLEREVDVFLLFYQYLAAQLISAGMPSEHVQALEREDVALDRKWDYLSPYLDFVRDNACARPPFEALRRFYDADDLTAQNYAPLTVRMQANNTIGLYDRCLREACGVVLVLNQNRTMWQTELFRPILFEDEFIGGTDRDSYVHLADDAAEPLPATLASLVELQERLLTRRRDEGMVGVKSIGYAPGPTDETEASLAYGHIVAGDPDAGRQAALREYLRHCMWEACGRLGLVVSIHTGVWAGNYADHTKIRPTNVLPIALAHPNTRFDLFHGGTPSPADAGLVARSTHNVYLNLCWSHLISPVQAEQALDLWLDYVPGNRIFAFGGDYWWNVENVYGALMQCREVLARVLAKRVEAGQFGMERALEHARRWLHDNPLEAYRLESSLA